ncbi:hypothetical protein GUJ93_ZPchr0003g18530 [Zizania palustris]|uniref:Uncharacterized protein n=1 Tax=Zizania palustris TaxID=103762 RepID=A0A8J5RZH2_ZIZPA|nr:hypothetical protein GUJ93_ZPchr0003g18530 [Zizania palustris]
MQDGMLTRRSTKGQTRPGTAVGRRSGAMVTRACIKGSESIVDRRAKDGISVVSPGRGQTQLNVVAAREKRKKKTRGGALRPEASASPISRRPRRTPTPRAYSLAPGVATPGAGQHSAPPCPLFLCGAIQVSCGVDPTWRRHGSVAPRNGYPNVGGRRPRRRRAGRRETGAVSLLATDISQA